METLPHNDDYERQFIGAVIINNEILKKTEVLPEYFFKPFHQKIVQAIVKIYNEAGRVDEFMVKDYINKDGTGDYLVELTTKCSVPANAFQYLEQIINLYELRKLVVAASEAQKMGIDRESPDSITTYLMDELKSIKVRGKEVEKISSIALRTFKGIEERSKQNSEVIGYSTGFRVIDKYLLGFQKGKQYVLAARPAMGKTALALNYAREVSKEVPVLFWTMEMSKEELTERVMAAEAAVDYTSLQKGDLTAEEWDKMTLATERIMERKLYIEDQSSATLEQVRRRLYAFKREHNEFIFILDYLQLMTSQRKGVPKEERVAENSRGLKALAGELKIVTILVAQLNRELEKRNDKRPILSDLRDSGQIEQDADTIMFLFREDAGDPNSKRKGIAEVDIHKNRSGKTKVVELAFIPEYQRFAPLKKEEEYGR